MERYFSRDASLTGASIGISVDQYDKMPADGRLNYYDPAEEYSMANVFTAKSDQLVRTVGVYTAEDNVSVTARVYRLDDGFRSPTDGALIASAEQIFPLGGYHRLELDSFEASPVFFKGQKYSVVVSQRDAAGRSVFVLSYAYARTDASAMHKKAPWTVYSETKAVVNPGESFLSVNGEWIDWAGDRRTQIVNELEAVFQADMQIDNFPIKAYGDLFAFLDPDTYYSDEELPGSAVTFDAAALESIAAQATGADLVLRVAPVDESRLNPKQKEALAHTDVEAVFDLSLTSDGKPAGFGGGSAVVAVAHRAKPEQKRSGFTVWYAAEDGTKVRNPTSATKDSVRFLVRHFSSYVLTYSDPGKCGKDETCPMHTFDDLDMRQWYHDGVHWALENEIMGGYGEGTFGPNDATSRAMLVAILHRLEGEPKAGSGADFADVAGGMWYTEAIRWAAANGIVNGYSESAFGPNDSVTREQLAAILYRFALYKGADVHSDEDASLTGYSDAAAVSAFAVPAMQWAAGAGIVSGRTSETLNPQDTATRAEIATVIMRYCEVTAEN